MFDKTVQSPEQKDTNKHSDLEKRDKLTQQEQLNSKSSSQICVPTNAEKPTMSRYASCWPTDFNNNLFKSRLSSPSTLSAIPEEEETVLDTKPGLSTGHNPFSFVKSWSNKFGSSLDPIIEEDEEFCEAKPAQYENP
ncbi:hypothetical protein [Legionella bononiensis]|uniref:Uncharacterized protein n=1 Tax=Legionella bononiensis TaxID=2793102 RepID=A0ABS1WE30_9GAMM|nr:hypothetical protein [Legionella bononiensis]MBL7479513.1 hypothetical protein [Legionella bononiensis]MBL7527613.1 hypothetical protein [Legionella bononiensis]